MEGELSRTSARGKEDYQAKIKRDREAVHAESNGMVTGSSPIIRDIATPLLTVTSTGVEAMCGDAQVDTITGSLSPNATAAASSPLLRDDNASPSAVPSSDGQHIISSSVFAPVARHYPPFSSTRAAASPSGSREGHQLLSDEKMQLVTPNDDFLQVRLTTSTPSFSGLEAPASSSEVRDGSPSASLPILARFRRSARAAEVSFPEPLSPSATRIAVASNAGTPLASHNASSVDGNVRSQGVRERRSSCSSTVPSALGGGSRSPTKFGSPSGDRDGMDGGEKVQQQRLEMGTKVSSNTAAGGEVSLLATARNGGHASNSFTPSSTTEASRPFKGTASNVQPSSSRSDLRGHFARTSDADMYPPNISYARAEADFRSSCSCRLPIWLTVTLSTVMTVILVAALTIVPLSSVSIRSANYVTSTLSLSLALSYTRAVEAGLMFLPQSINAFAFSLMESSDMPMWRWTSEDMPRVMQHMCHTVAGAPHSEASFLLYLSLNGPYAGYSAYCSQQYGSSNLVGNYITHNTSQPRYQINASSFTYTAPAKIYPAVVSMTPWEYAVDFGGEGNVWNQVVMPWFAAYKAQRTTEETTVTTDATASSDFGSTTSMEPERRPALTHPPSLLDGYWRLFSVDSVKAITYTFPFVDYTGNPAYISAALQPNGFESFTRGGLIAPSSTARAMAVDTLSGLVFHTSWGQDTTIWVDHWNKTSNCTPAAKQQRSLYLEDIDDPLMRSAVKHIGGRKGIATTPVRVEQWTGRFSGDGSDNLIVVSQIGVTPATSGMSLIVLYVVRMTEFTDSISEVQKSALIAVVTVLGIMVLVEVAFLYLLVQPVRGIAAGLRAAAELRDGSDYVDGVMSVVKEVADMQHDFRIMNAKLMQMKTFLPQGMLGAPTYSGDTMRTSDGNASVPPRSLSYTAGDGSELWGDARADGSYGASRDIFGDAGDGHDGSRLGGGFGEAHDGNEDAAELHFARHGGRSRYRSDSPFTGTHLRLIDRVLLEEVNHFRRQYCTIIVFCMHLMEAEINVRFLDEHCAYFMQGVLPCVLRYGGVVELQRPDYIVVSFGAHNKVPMHQNRAAKCALEVMHLFNTTTSIGPRVGCMVDASEYYVGTCGAADRNALVTFNYSLVAKNDLIRVLKSVQTQILLTQRLASTLEDSMVVMPVDCMVLNPIGKRDEVLYELRGHIRMLPTDVPEALVRQVLRAVRTGFSHMLHGDYERALEHLMPCESRELQAARLSFMCRAFIARHCNRRFVRSVTRLTFSEANFAGYNENPSAEKGDSNIFASKHGSNPYASLKNPNAAGNALLSVSPGATLSFSPFTNDLDPTTLLTTPPTMRLVVGAALCPPAPSEQEAKVRSPNGSLTRAAVAATPIEAPDSLPNDDLGSTPVAGEDVGGLPEVAGFSEAGRDEGETALFEMFVEDQPDDDDEEEEEHDVQRVEAGGTWLREAGGGGAFQAYASFPATEKGTPRETPGDGSFFAVGSRTTPTVLSRESRRLRRGELPFFFKDYEGNSWRRSYDVLDKGAFSTVYRGLSMSGNLVALKCFQLRARNIDVHAIVDEIRLFANLHHENVVQYLSLYVSEQYVIEIMEFVPGGSLDTLLRSFGSLQAESVRRYLRDVTRGLHYLHSACIVHCDIKPHNVLLAMDGQCKLSDFGSAIARATSSICKIDDVLEMRGTPGYMSPEVARGEVPTMKSDVYSLGITTLMLLTGKLPWDYADAYRPSSPMPASRRGGQASLSGLSSQLGGPAPYDGETPTTVANLSTLPPAEEMSDGTHQPTPAPHPPQQYDILSQPSGSVHLSRSVHMAPPSTVSTSTSSLATDTVLASSHNSNGAGKHVTVATSGTKGVIAEGALAGTTIALRGGGTNEPDAHGTTDFPVAVSMSGKAREVEMQRPAPPIGEGAPTREREVGAGVTAVHRNGAPTDVPPRCSVSPSHRRPIDQILRSPTQLVVCIGRGVVVPRIPDTLDEDAVDFLELCLHPDPTQRASMEELLHHPWLM